MKKIGLLLLVCIMAVFAACDDKGKEKDPVPVNPVTEYKVPETGGIGKDVTVAGKGFPKESKIFLKGADAALKEATVKTVTAVDLVFTVPADVKAGEYTIVLKIKDAEYELGKIKLEAVCPVTEIEVPKEARVGEMILIGGKDFAKDCEISLRPATGSAVEIPAKDIEHVENGIRFTLPELTLDTDYLVFLMQKGEWELGKFTVKGPIPRVQTITCQMGYTEDATEKIEFVYTYKFTYDKEGRIATFTRTQDGVGREYVVKYGASKIEVTCQYKEENISKTRTYVYNLDANGRVASSTITLDSKPQEYTYEYDKNGFLAKWGIDNYAYDQDGNLTTAWDDKVGKEEGFSFTYEKSIKYDILNLDPFAFILDDYFGFSDLNVRLLGICGKKPANLPGTAYGQFTNYNMGYRFTKGEPKMINYIEMLDPEGGAFMRFELKY